jgi:RNA polymerase sigma-70 factor, ECF subfamily
LVGATGAVVGGRDDPVVAAAVAGDEAAFATLVERHRHELHVHCYRMLGSFTDAEDLVQDVFLKAWRGRAAFEGRSTFRAWLYRIATNGCLDALGHSSRRTVPVGAGGDADVEGLQPYPDALLDRVAPTADQPDAVVVARETIELAFLAAIRHLPPRQRAVLIARDVLGWSASETASLLDTTVASATSLLQRARARLAEVRPAPRDVATIEPSAEELAVLQRYVEAHERADLGALVAILHDDVHVTMPPEAPAWGRAEATAAFRQILDPDVTGEWRVVPVGANRQPAVANYLRRPGDARYRALSIDLLRVEDGRLVAIDCFLSDELFPAFGLPLVLADEG